MLKYKKEQIDMLGYVDHKSILLGDEVPGVMNVNSDKSQGFPGVIVEVNGGGGKIGR